MWEKRVMEINSGSEPTQLIQTMELTFETIILRKWDRNYNLNISRLPAKINTGIVAEPLYKAKGQWKGEFTHFSGVPALEPWCSTGS